MNHHFRDQFAEIGNRLETLAEGLRAFGYAFVDENVVLPGPEAEVDRIVQRIESEIGRVPQSICDFWSVVGSVDFRGSRPDWSGCDYPDPIVVYPSSMAEYELDEFLLDREERLHCDFPYCIPIAPDLFHKEDVSGGMWYNVSVPAVADDPPLNDEWHQTTFMRYLEVCLEHAGFPGLAQCEGHTWPIDKLFNER